MDITEAEAGMMKLQREPADLCQLAREVVELYEYVAEEKKITVRTGPARALRSLGGPHPHAAGLRQPAGQRHQIHPRRRQRDDLRARRTRPAPWRVFRDTGIGIPAEEQDKIWPRLYRGDKSRSQRGLGLGLSLVKAVVEAHGGKVTVSSQVNQGSEFVVSLPKQSQAG